MVVELTQILRIMRDFMNLYNAIMTMAKTLKKKYLSKLVKSIRILQITQTEVSVKNIIID